MDKSPGRVYVSIGRWGTARGLVWEAAMAAGHYGLDNLVAFVDWNGLQIDGKNDDCMTVTPLKRSFKLLVGTYYLIDGMTWTRLWMD